MLTGHNQWSKDSQLQTVTVWIQGGKGWIPLRYRGVVREENPGKDNGSRDPLQSEGFDEESQEKGMET